jgi:DNA-binding NtrC family response regulator
MRRRMSSRDIETRLATVESGVRACIACLVALSGMHRPMVASPDYRETLASSEAAMIEQALRECGGHQVRAARKLGITPRALSYKIKARGLRGMVLSLRSHDERVV